MTGRRPDRGKPSPIATASNRAREHRRGCGATLIPAVQRGLMQPRCVDSGARFRRPTKRKGAAKLWYSLPLAPQSASVASDPSRPCCAHLPASCQPQARWGRHFPQARILIFGTGDSQPHSPAA